MKILVTGDREWDNFNVMINALKVYPSDTIIIHGYCKGADLSAEVIAQELGMKTIGCPAHWSHNDRIYKQIYGPCDVTCSKVVGKVAGVTRNGFMLDEHKPERILAFHNDLSRSTGTLDMIKRGRKAGLDVDLFTYDGLIGTNPPVTKLALKQYLLSHKKKEAYEIFYQ